MAEKIILCPLMGGECIKDGTARLNAEGKAEVVACRFWVHIAGRSPQGGTVDNWECTFALLPLLLIENAKVGRETGAAVESFRNVSATHANSVQRALGALVTFASGVPPVLSPSERSQPRAVSLQEAQGAPKLIESDERQQNGS